MWSVGVDGCRAGWLAISLQGFDKWQVEPFLNIEKLWEKYRDSDVIILDIPIGLREEGVTERLCDPQARRLLRPKRSSSVFPAPCRPAVYCESYKKASEQNKDLTGRKLSTQTWAITPKIREVDVFLKKCLSARDKIKESHPELCFRMLSGKAMKHNKRKIMGQAERIGVLEPLYAQTGEIIEFAISSFKKKDVAPDDIIDALCLAVTGLIGLERGFATIPQVPEKDSHGLDMQMIYCDIAFATGISHPIRLW
jgi:predicted RNase H-like nuclease